MILCAAVRIQINDGKTIQIIEVPCHRHGDGFRIMQTMREINSDPMRIIRVIEQGFITHNGEFLNRKDAYKHAIECGQISITTQWYKEDRFDTELYSEDLY